MSDHQYLSGPDFLAAVAQVEIASGLTINAAEFNRRSAEWASDLEARDAADAKASQQAQAAAAWRTILARAYDQLSAIRPGVEQLQDYEQLRVTIASLAGIPGGPVAWRDDAIAGDRDPRRMPMPGDRFHLPVEVDSAVYKESGLSISYRPMLPGNDGTLEPCADIPFVIVGCPTWSHGAIAVVAAKSNAASRAA